MILNSWAIVVFLRVSTDSISALCLRVVLLLQLRHAYNFLSHMVAHDIWIFLDIFFLFHRAETSWRNWRTSCFDTNSITCRSNGVLDKIDLIVSSFPPLVRANSDLHIYIYIYIYIYQIPKYASLSWSASFFLSSGIAAHSNHRKNNTLVWITFLHSWRHVMHNTRISDR